MHSGFTRLANGFEFGRMKSPDPASLQNLNDIVLPATVGWWPLAPGWYVLFGLLLIALGWFGYRSLHRWINNRYRRAALSELQLLAEGAQSATKRDASLRQIPVLLKRTALAAYPRNQVASLSGKDWVHFLNSKIRTPSFTEPVSSTLDKLSYSTGDLNAVDSQAASALLNASELWLKRHQATARSKNSKGT